MRVLLADDQPNVRSALRLLLEQKAGVSAITEARSSSELLAQAKKACPDLVLLDWELPGRKGVELVPAMKAVCPELFVIALSSRPEARQEALRAGADDFVSKGGPPQEVFATVNKYQRRDETKHQRGGRQ